MRFGSPPPPRRRHLAVLLALAGVASLVGSVAVGALEGEPFRVAEGEPGGGTYGPIVTSDPVTVTVDGTLVTPEECKVMTGCMTVPFDVVVPSGLKETDDFFANIAVGWTDPNHVSDVDIFVWDDGQQAVEEAEAEGEEPPASKTYTPQSDSASSANPEIARLFEPTYGRYNLVMFNFSGPPIEVDVAAELVVARFSTPFELLAPEAEPSASGPPRPRAAVTPDRAPAPAVAEPAPSGEAATTDAPSLPTIELATDDDFDDFEEADFDESLVPELTAEDELALAALAEEMAANRTQEPSGAALFLSLVAAPLLFVSAAGAWFWRRSPAAMHFD